MDSIGKVSVVIPAHDAADFLGETLDSVLSQDHPDLEVIVVDDASTDDTPGVMASYGDRIVSIRLDVASGGPSRPRNEGATAASGEFIAFIDSDDLMEPGALSDSLGVMARHPDVSFVFAGLRSIDEQGEVIDPDYLSEYREFRRDLAPTDDPAVGLLSGDKAYSGLLHATFVFTSSVVMRRALWEEAGPFDEEMKNGDDRDMWMRSALTGATFAFIDRPHFSYRKRTNSVTNRGWLRMPSVIRMMEKHVRLARTDADRRLAADRLNRARLAYAYGLREAGRLDESIDAYRAALGERMTRRGVLGIMKARLLKLAGRRPA